MGFGPRARTKNDRRPSFVDNYNLRPRRTELTAYPFDAIKTPYDNVLICQA